MGHNGRPTKRFSKVDAGSRLAGLADVDPAARPAAFSAGLLARLHGRGNWVLTGVWRRVLRDAASQQSSIFNGIADCVAYRL